MEIAEKFDRVLALEGGRNFRDLGGYATHDGRRLKWGKLYRSGSMAQLSAGAYEQLAALGVRSICDLRTTYEREANPVDWRRVPNLSYWARDYDMSFGDLRTVLASDLPTAEMARAGMLKGYRQLPFEQAPSYAELFRMLAAGEVPLVFNCSAGKDRTGTAAALILSVLGVPRETILADYALTQVYSPPREMMRMVAHSGGVPGIPPEQAKAFAAMPPEVMQVMMGSDPAVMRQALAKIDAKFGGPVQLTKDRYGLTDAKIAYLRQSYLI